MEWFEALVLGIIQGLTEFLPVSSSGHLQIFSALFGLEGEENLTFAVAVHAATVCGTIVILWKEVSVLFKGFFTFKYNDEMAHVLKIFLSMIPVAIVGFCFKDYVEALFGSGLTVVGCMLLVTAVLLSFAYYAKPRVKEKISYRDAFVIGLAQACAVLPGLSRSGSTIATGILLGNKKEAVAQVLFFDGIDSYSGGGFSGSDERRVLGRSKWYFDRITIGWICGSFYLGMYCLSLDD